MDGTLTGTFASGQSEPRRNGNEGILHIPQSSGLKPQHQMV